VKRNFMRFLVTFFFLSFPLIGYCDSANGWFKNLFEQKDKNTKDVASKVAELHESDRTNVSGLAFSPDSNQIAVKSLHETVRVWDWKDDRIVSVLEKAEGASSGLTTEPMLYSQDGQFLAACHSRAVNDVVIRIWKTGIWKVAHDIVDSVPGGCYAIGFTPDGKSLVRIANRNPQFPSDNLIVYDVDTWKPVWGLQTLPFQPHALAVSPDGKFAALGGEVIAGAPIAIKEQIVIVDLMTRSILRTIPNTVSFSFGRLAWSPDGNSIAAVGRRAWDGSANQGNGAYIGGPDTVMAFDANSGKQVAGAQWAPVSHLSLRYTPDGKYLIEGDMNGRNTGLGVRIWDAQHRELIQEIGGNIGSLAVSKDGHYLAIGSDKKTTIWQLR
jgi:WD40 repeat protein